MDGNAAAKITSALETLDPRAYEHMLSSANPRDARRVRRLVEYKSISEWITMLPRQRGAELLANTNPYYAAQVCRCLKKAIAHQVFDAMGPQSVSRMLAGQDLTGLAVLADLMGAEVMARVLESGDAKEAASLWRRRPVTAPSVVASLSMKRLAAIISPTKLSTRCVYSWNEECFVSCLKTTVGSDATDAWALASSDAQGWWSDGGCVVRSHQRRRTDGVVDAHDVVLWKVRRRRREISPSSSSSSSS